MEASIYPSLTIREFSNALVNLVFGAHFARTVYLCIVKMMITARKLIAPLIVCTIPISTALFVTHRKHVTHSSCRSSATRNRGRTAKTMGFVSL
ncbi:hypothetical protein Ciccas_007809 [Cichlidogyrus casuarinus]|uniref:Uncharacterized protein n=1 Tax=Cichlidogyrus casuarinus TaxID=1844966 RepID=A0ABD2Q1U8_9PLAT